MVPVPGHTLTSVSLGVFEELRRPDSEGHQKSLTPAEVCPFGNSR